MLCRKPAPPGIYRIQVRAEFMSVRPPPATSWGSSIDIPPFFSFVTARRTRFKSNEIARSQPQNSDAARRAHKRKPEMAVVMAHEYMSHECSTSHELALSAALQSNGNDSRSV